MTAAPSWTPDPAAASGSRIARFTEFAAARTGTSHPDYPSLWQWSVRDLAGFWSAVWDFFDLRSGAPYDGVLDDAPMPGTRWFPGARLNYAEHALRARGPQPAVVSVAEDGTTTRTSRDELRRQVGSLDALRARISAALRARASPRHVPDAILAVPAVPHTRTGKKLEVPVKRLLQGASTSEVVSREAIDDFEALAYFTRFAQPAASVSLSSREIARAVARTAGT
jgi:hypothetical protein